MASWTKRQIEILMDWVEENNEYSEKCIWAKRYYDVMYLIIYIPSIIITAYLSSTPSANFVAPVIVNQAITTLDKFFNFGKLASEYEGYSNLFQNFSDRILEELVKPESVKQNGSIFYHDMNWEKQRLGDKTKPIPWIVEKIYNYYKIKNTKNKVANPFYTDSDEEYTSSNTSSSSHGIIYQVPVRKKEKFANATIYTQKHNNAAIVIQNAWYNWCVANGKINHVKTMHVKRSMPKLVKQIVSTQNRKLKKTNYGNVSSCNLMLPNPQTKMQKKLAKMIHESINIQPQDAKPLTNQLHRFNNNFSDGHNTDFFEIGNAV